MPRRTPSARVGSLLVGLGAKELKWKCQRRGCERLIPRDEIACDDHLALLPYIYRALMVVALRKHPIGHPLVSAAARALDRAWRETADA